MTSASDGKRVLVLGLACVDMINVVREFPVEDSDQRVEDYYWQKGGNAANTSSVLALLGSNTEYMGCFANDFEMRFLREDFASFGVKTENCRIYETTTPTSTIIINSKTGSRTILHASKKLPEVCLEDFQKLKLDNYKWIHFEGRPNMNTDTYEIVKMLEHIELHNKTVNTEDQVQFSVELEKAYRPELDILLDKARYVFVSKEYSQSKGFQTKQAAAIGLIKRCREGASIICPWGEEGALARTWDGVMYRSPAYPPETLTDTLAAGDTFIAATLHSLCSGQNLGEAINFGCKVAGTKCGMRGLQGLKDVKF